MGGDLTGCWSDVFSQFDPSILVASALGASSSDFVSHVARSALGGAGSGGLAAAVAERRVVVAGVDASKGRVVPKAEVALRSGGVALAVGRSDSTGPSPIPTGAAPVMFRLLRPWAASADLAIDFGRWVLLPMADADSVVKSLRAMAALQPAALRAVPPSVIPPSVHIDGNAPLDSRGPAGGVWQMSWIAGQQHRA